MNAMGKSVYGCSLPMDQAWLGAEETPESVTGHSLHKVTISQWRANAQPCRTYGEAKARQGSAVCMPGLKMPSSVYLTLEPCAFCSTRLHLLSDSPRCLHVPGVLGAKRSSHLRDDS